MMPLGAPSISKYGSLVQPDAQIVALRAQCARTALKAPPQTAEFARTDASGTEMASTSPLTPKRTAFAPPLRRCGSDF